MNIDHAYKGGLGRTIELFDSGMCDGPNLQVGKQYLMYTSGSPDQPVPARGCTRSRRIEDADEDLEFLKAYEAGKFTTHIDGTVRFRPDGTNDTEDARTPLGDVRVTLSSDGKEFHATTTSAGTYSLSNLPPGEYTIDADLQGYRLNWAPDDLTLAAHGCIKANLLMMIDRQVRGAVRYDSGASARGARVQLVSVGQTRYGRTIREAVSDERGRYTIDDIPPGDYYLGINIGSAPVKEHPYPVTYYPSTPDIRQATRISIGIGANVQDFDLRVPGRLSVVTVRGRIQTASGTPPPLQDRPQIRIREPGLSGQIETKEIEVDAEGRFRYDLCEGIRYSVSAFSGAPKAKTYSAPVEFTPAGHNDQLILILDKTAEEFGKLQSRDR